ncbi:hypothetical protein Tco_0027150 [Tanacetum coccineum]
MLLTLKIWPDQDDQSFGSHREHVSHKKFSNGGAIMVEDDPDIIHVDNSSDLALSPLNDLENLMRLAYREQKQVWHDGEGRGWDDHAQVAPGFVFGLEELSLGSGSFGPVTS